MARHVIGPAAEFPPGSQRRVTIAGRGIAVFHVDGVLRALKSTCPHQGADLADGTVVGAISSEGPGCYRYDGTRKFVKCPWHGWEFDLDNGQSWFDPARKRVRAYDVSIAKGSTLLDTGAPPADGERRPGPYVAETIPISVENDYVIVDL
jgi:3-phenylpropionate/trans-cinnamate dioxygenase ferredoxin subunit